MTGPSPFQVTSRTSGTAVVVTVAGEFELPTAHQVETAITEGMAAQPSAMVLDLSAVTFLDSAGLAVLARAHAAAGDRVALRVVAPHRAVRRRLELAGMDAMLVTFRTVAEALARA